MSKSEIYSWRVTPETKAALEHEARRDGLSLGSLLERISTDWLKARRSRNGSDAKEQQRLQAKAARLIGSIAGGDPGRSAKSRESIRRRLLNRQGERRAASSNNVPSRSRGTTQEHS